MKPTTQTQSVHAKVGPVLLGLQLHVAFSALAALPGDVDTTFRPDASVATANRILAAAGSSTGQLLVVLQGTNGTKLVQLNPDGQLDARFKTVALTGFALRGFAVQPDGKILCATYPDTANPTRCRIERFDATGKPDSRFQFDQVVQSVDSITPLGDGGILLGSKFGEPDDFTPALFLHHLNPLGEVNPDFNLSGEFNAIGNMRQVVVQSDGRLVLSGLTLERVSATGVREPDYGGNSLKGRTHAVVPLPDGRLMVAGRFENDQGIVRSQVIRLKPDGTIDPAYTATDYVGEVNRMALTPGGRIVIGGPFDRVGGLKRIGVARLLADGGVDSGFVCNLSPSGPLPGALTEIQVAGLGFLQDGRLFVGGSFIRHNGEVSVPPLVVVNAGELLDGPPRFVSFPERVSIVEGQTLEIPTRLESAVPGTVEWRKGATVLSGATTPELRIRNVSLSNADDYQITVTTSLGTVSKIIPVEVLPAPSGAGAVDPQFDLGSGAGGWFSMRGEPEGRVLMARGAKGRVYTAGDFKDFEGRAAAGLIAIKENGQIDEEFRWNPAESGYYLHRITALKVTASGDLFVGASFSQSESQPITQTAVWKIFPDGSRDTTFIDDSGVGVARRIETIEVDAKGRILVARVQVPRMLTRLLPTGERDPDFHEARYSVLALGEQSIRTILPLENGSIMVGGNFWTVDQSFINGLVRLTEDGVVDTSFKAGLHATVPVQRVKQAQDGGLLVATEFPPELVKLDSKGARIAAFNSPRELNIIDDLALDSEGRILFSTYEIVAVGEPPNYIPRYIVRRLLPDGKDDPDFQFQPSFQVPLSLQLQDDGQLLVGGRFEGGEGMDRSTVIRVNGTDERRIDLKRATDGSAVLRWNSRKARVYKIEEATNLAAPDWTLVHTMEGTGSGLEWNGGAITTKRFFRIRLD